MTDQKSNSPTGTETAAHLKLNDQFADVKRVPEIEVVEGERTPDGRAIQYDEYGKAYTVSTPQTGGLRTYLDEEEYPPLHLEIAPPALKVTPPQSAAAAASQFDPVPEKDARSGLQTSAAAQPAILPVTGSAPASSAPTFSTNEAAAAEAKKAAAPAATQAVIDAVLNHPAAQPKGGPK